MGGVILILLIIALGILFLQIPVMIAKNRGITGSELSTISILSWLSILLGITWFIALILALVYQPKSWIGKDEDMSETDLNKLDKLYELKRKGVISDTEYECEKANILNKN